MRLRVLACVAILTLWSRGCGPVPAGSVRLISDQVPPTFEFRGRSELQHIHVVGPYFADNEGSTPGHAAEVWKISPPGFRFIPTNEIPHITYGRLPENWEQEVPRSGSPPTLVNGGIYYVDAELIKGRRINLCVAIREGKAEVFQGKLGQLECE